jgi:hypothetical protein
MRLPGDAAFLGETLLLVPSMFWEQSLSCLVELEGTHRYKDCPVLQRIMPKIRNEGLSEEDRKILNSRVINGDSVKMPRPEETRFATFNNANRWGINIDVFRSYLEKYHADCTEDNIPESAIVIKSKASWGSVRKRVLQTVGTNILIRCYALDLDGMLWETTTKTSITVLPMEQLPSL